MPLTNAFRRSLYLSLGLACACLAYSEEPFLPGVLLILWLAAFIWSLALFYLYREARRVAPAPPGGLRAGPMFRATGRWTVRVVALSLLCFLLTPRLNIARWELPSRARLETGVT